VAHDRGSDVLGELAGVEVEGFHAHPALRCRARPGPRLVAAPGVDGLTVVDVVGHGRRRPGRPGLVGADHLSVPVGEGELELGDGAEPVTVQRALAAPGQPAAVPAVAEGDPEHRALGDELADVVRAVADPPLVAAPPGAEHVGGDGCAVQRRLEDPEGGDVESGVDHVAVSLVDDDLPAEQRRSVELLGWRDHDGGPVHWHAAPCLLGFGVDGCRLRISP
jgi:hypothetical protein